MHLVGKKIEEESKRRPGEPAYSSVKRLSGEDDDDNTRIIIIARLPPHRTGRGRGGGGGVHGDGFDGATVLRVPACDGEEDDVRSDIYARYG